MYQCRQSSVSYTHPQHKARSCLDRLLQCISAGKMYCLAHGGLSTLDTVVPNPQL